MRSLLIADATGELAKGIRKQLNKLYQVQVCQKGEKLAECLQTVDPEILLLDMSIPGADCLALLQSLVSAGKRTAVLVILNLASDYVLSRLQSLGVKYIFMKPCAVNMVVSHIRQMDFMLQYPDMTTWCLENETENILLDLGFCVGKSRYYVVCRAVRYKYENCECQMKQIYLSLAKERGTADTQVEKAIRDAIIDAYKNGDPDLWRMYFTPKRNSKTPCPTNEEFVARIAECLRQRTRLKKPYTAKAE